MDNLFLDPDVEIAQFDNADITASVDALDGFVSAHLLHRFGRTNQAMQGRLLYPYALTFIASYLAIILTDGQKDLREVELFTKQLMLLSERLIAANKNLLQ